MGVDNEGVRSIGGGIFFRRLHDHSTREEVLIEVCEDQSVSFEWTPDLVVVVEKDVHFITRKLGSGYCAF